MSRKQAKLLTDIMNDEVKYPPSLDQIEDFVAYVQRLKGTYQLFLDRYQKSNKDSFVFSGYEADFDLLWMAYHLAHLTISCVPVDDKAPMRVMLRYFQTVREFDPPEDFVRMGIKTIEDLMMIQDPRIRDGICYLFGTGRMNPMTYLANLTDRLFRTRTSRRLA